jgi:beta-lactamase regulating signal transducer with metallopeptidase domain
MVSVGATMVRQSWPGASALPWTSVAGGAWALGVVLVLARLAWAWRARATLARGARPVTDPAWVAALDAAAATIGLRRRVRLLRAPGVGTPMTWGTLRPAVLLPEDARAWPAAHREAVLLHELAHVRRLDCLLAALGHVACAAWWFHPGVWWAARRLGLERERACDERVLAAGVRPSDYAECLLRVAESARHARAAGPALVAAGFVGRSQLRARVHAILRPPAAPRWAPGRLASGRFGPAAAVAGALALALPVGTLRLAPRPDVFWTALRSPDWATRASAAEHLARFGDARTVAALDAALRDERHPAVPAMARFGARLRAPAGGPAPLTLAAPAAR